MSKIQENNNKVQDDNNKSQYVGVVVLDEVGLAEDSPNLPLKVLHPLLEDGTEGNSYSVKASIVLVIATFMFEYNRL